MTESYKDCPMRNLLKKAYEKNPRALTELHEIYATTDMSERTYIALVKIIAEGDE